MEYQTDGRNHRSQEVRIGQDGREVAAFKKVNFLIHNLKADVGGFEYQLKRAAPWNGFRYQLCRDGLVVASAACKRRMHAFEPDRPLIRHVLVEFQIEQARRTLTLTPVDRHGSTFVLDEAGQERGRLAMRSFDAQMGGDWEADLTPPDGWAVPQAAFVAWLAREARSKMSS